MGFQSVQLCLALSESSKSDWFNMMTVKIYFSILKLGSCYDIALSHIVDTITKDSILYCKFKKTAGLFDKQNVFLGKCQTFNATQERKDCEPHYKKRFRS